MRLTTEVQADAEMVTIEYFTEHGLTKELTRIYGIHEKRDRAMWENIRGKAGEGFHNYVLEWLQTGGPVYITGWPELHEYMYGRG